MKKFVYDGRLIFDTSVHLPGDAMILDAGTGTGKDVMYSYFDFVMNSDTCDFFFLLPGIWLLELHQCLSESATLYGIDLAPNQFPKDNVPKNVHFRIASITNLPQEWTGQFDFVNQRLLGAGLLAKDWPAALENYMRVLKPGGHIQLAEFVPVSSKYGVGPHSSKFGELASKILKNAGLMPDCAERFPTMLQEAGFIDIRSERKIGPVGDARGKDGAMGKISIGGAMKAMREAFLAYGLVENEDAYEELVTGSLQEWEANGGFDMAYSIVIAERP